ncbi:MAG: hypothetical protein AB8G17_20185 [Gammaproteobacteria bacterium]
MNKYLLTSLLALTSVTANADPSYQYIQTSWVRLHFADIDAFRPIGLQIEGSYAFADDFFARLSYTDADDSEATVKFDVEQWQAAFGYVWQFSHTTAMDLQLGYGDIALAGRSASTSARTGTQYWSVGWNVRHMLNQNIELVGGLEWQTWRKGSDQKAYTLGGQYHFDRFSVGAEYTKYSDSEWVGVTGRFSF